jgi:hypothetical protein
MEDRNLAEENKCFNCSAWNSYEHLTRICGNGGKWICDVCVAESNRRWDEARSMAKSEPRQPLSINSYARILELIKTLDAELERIANVLERMDQRLLAIEDKLPVTKQSDSD